MIISASRRTDIPAFYSEWLLARLRAGEVLYPNPWNSRQFYRVALAPAHVDCIVFWTKNPRPLLGKLDVLDGLGYSYYFSFTVTAYGQDLEPGLPPKAEVLDTFLRLADRLGPKRVDWRFDPVAVSAERPLDWHLERFGRICARLRGATERCIMNFMRPYRQIAPRLAGRPDLSDLAVEMTGPAKREAALALAALAAQYEIPFYTCADREELSGLLVKVAERGDEPGAEKGEPAPLKSCACIDREKIEAVSGRALKIRKDPGQPTRCHCVESADIGMYGTCAHGCVYCYANGNEKELRRRIAGHSPQSPLLTGEPPVGASVSDRTRPSHRDERLKLF